MIAIILAIASKDLRIEWRHRTAFFTAVVFAVLVLLAFVFSHGYGGDTPLAALAPSVLWVMLALTTIVSLNRGFLLERENGALDGMLVAPISPSALFWGKWIANMAIVLVVEIVAIPLWMLFFNLDPALPWRAIALIAVLAAAAFTAAGTLFSAMAVRTRFAEMLLPVLLLPFLIPPLFFASQGTLVAMSRSSGDDLGRWLRLLALYDVAFLTLASLLFPVVMDP